MEEKGRTLDAKIRGGNTELNIGSGICLYCENEKSRVFIFFFQAYFLYSHELLFCHQQFNR